MAEFELAQINIARFRLPKEDPVNADFINALDHVNAMAEASPGFVWRLVGDGNNATDVEAVPGDPNLIVNMSVWRDIAALEAFVYGQADHLAIMRRRKEWFDRIDTAMALWWVPAGERPTVADAMARLAHLDAHGPTPRAFTFRQHFPAQAAA